MSDEPKASTAEVLFGFVILGLVMLFALLFYVEYQESRIQTELADCTRIEEIPTGRNTGQVRNVLWISECSDGDRFVLYPTE